MHYDMHATARLAHARAGMHFNMPGGIHLEVQVREWSFLSNPSVPETIKVGVLR